MQASKRVMQMLTWCENRETCATRPFVGYLGEAVDKVRRQEHKELMAQGDETLKGTRQLWLYNPQNFSPDQAEEFSALKDLQLKVARAWAAKELFSKFWEYQEKGWA